MKWPPLLAVIMLCSTVGWAQQSLTQLPRAKVTFQKDSADWVAVVPEKDTVSVLFKMMFAEPIDQALPPDGYYQIQYNANLIRFNRLHKSGKYVFYVTEPERPTTEKGTRQWLIIGLARMNPVCFPPKSKP